MITRFHVKNYKALRDVSLDLGPMQLLIGPNDSGKTSILEAVGALCRSVDRPLAQAFDGNWYDRELVWQDALDAVVMLAAAIATPDGRGIEYELDCRFSPANRKVEVAREAIQLRQETLTVTYPDIPQSFLARVRAGEQFTDASHVTAAVDVVNALRGVHYYRWVPRMLALPAAPEAARSFQMDASGFGLARCLDDILGFDRERFSELEQRFRDIFPTVETIRLKQERAFKSTAGSQYPVPMLSEADGKGIYIRFRNQPNDVPARQLSDGLLLVLAYLTVLYLPEPPRVVLVEEPENGIHPLRLGEVVRALRHLVSEQSHTQVLLTTHSPYVVDMFAPKEVTLCVKQNDGSIRVRNLSESEEVRKQIDVFTLGEIWTADGDERLLQPSPDRVESSG